MKGRAHLRILEMSFSVQQEKREPENRCFKILRKQETVEKHSSVHTSGRKQDTINSLKIKSLAACLCFLAVTDSTLTLEQRLLAF